MLEHSTTTDALAVIIAAFRRYRIIWTCMNATGVVANALYVAHQSWKTRGLQSRDLLTLLIEIDNSRFLDSVARDQVTADISAFTHVRVSASLPIFTYTLPRRYVPRLINPNLFLQCSRRFFFSLMIPIQRLLRFWPTPSGTNIAPHMTGRGRFGITLLPAFGKSL
jgi:hypothetical protein